MKPPSPLSRTASFKTQSRIFWSRSSKRTSGRSLTGFGQDGAATALWSIFAWPCDRWRRPKMAGANGHPTKGSSRAISIPIPYIVGVRALIGGTAMQSSSLHCLSALAAG